MNSRTPLKTGTIITMPNGGQYVIEESIGKGGFSLVYTAKTKNNGYPVIVKEFFPSEHAHRARKTIKASDGTIVEMKNRVYPDAKSYSERFKQYYKAFEQEGQLGSEARLNNFQIISFADCGEGYAILPRWSNDTCSFKDLEEGWRLDAAPEIIDPVFTDLGRVRFALTAISSLLYALSSLHEHNMLHLDISPSNVVWAGSSRTNPDNGTSLLTDFGCSVLKEADGSYPVEYVLSYSPKYAAPEYKQTGNCLDFTSDIYAVGRLLVFLCCGERAFDLHTNLFDEVSRLKIAKRHQEPLLAIMTKATEYEMSSRYQSAAEMAAEVNELLDMIPLHAINADNKNAFTLYSLKSMLEGSLGTGHSWFDELCDRRGVRIPIPDSVLAPVANIPNGSFSDDIDFLNHILPRSILTCFCELNTREIDGQTATAIMSCSYPDEWKRAISSLILNDGSKMGLRKMFANGRSVLAAENLFADDISMLFQLPGEDIAYFENCYTLCVYESAKDGFMLLIMFALLGQGKYGFGGLANHSPSKIYRLITG